MPGGHSQSLPGLCPTVCVRLLVFSWHVIDLALITDTFSFLFKCNAITQTWCGKFGGVADLLSSWNKYAKDSAILDEPSTLESVLYTVHTCILSPPYAVGCICMQTYKLAGHPVNHIVIAFNTHIHYPKNKIDS